MAKVSFVSHTHTLTQSLSLWEYRYINHEMYTEWTKSSISISSIYLPSTPLTSRALEFQYIYTWSQFDRQTGWYEKPKKKKKYKVKK